MEESIFPCWQVLPCCGSDDACIFFIFFFGGGVKGWQCVLSSTPTHICVLSPLFSQGRPVEILPFLYLGSAYHASRQDYLSDLHITALLNVSRRDLQPAKGRYDYKWIPVEDSHMADISSHFQEAIEFIGELKGTSSCFQTFVSGFFFKLSFTLKIVHSIT